MISVCMGVDHRVQPRDICPEGLQPEFDGRVNYPRSRRSLDITEDLQRWSRLSEDRHTEQSHRGTGMPTEVPVPKKVAVSIY